MSKIGYIIVSTEHQETARQQEIMCDYQVDRIFSEKLSGANTDRPQLRAMLDYVRRAIPSLCGEHQPSGTLYKGLAEHYRHTHRQMGNAHQP